MYRVDESFFVYSRYIENLRRSGGKYSSPLRDDPIPSFQINPANGKWFDYGMGAGGDVIDFIKLRHDVSYGKAKSIISSMLDGYSNIDLALAHHVATKEKHVKRAYKFTHDAVIKATQRLHESKGVIRMLWNRGLSYDVIREYRLGITNYYGKDWLLLPYEFTDGHIWQYKRIRWEEGVKEVRTTGTGVLYPTPMLKHDTLVVCEGELDCLALISNGILSVTGTCGAGVFKYEWAKQLRGKNLIFLYDNDDAGQAGMTKAAYVLKSEGINMPKILYWNQFIPDCEKGFDVCQYMEEGRDVQELRAFIYG